jgi:proteasome lid subunit RPN8/RPN11
MTWKDDALTHAKAESPKEACGLLVIIKGRKRYWPCKNLSTDLDNFILDPDDFCKAEDTGSVIAIIHSHPVTPPYPSSADRVACHQSGMPWHIVSPATETWFTCEPEEYEPELVGREWVWNVMDCWSCVRSWYKQHGLQLDDYKRPTTPEEFESSPLFEKYWAEAGFYQIPEGEQVQEGDAILMAIGGSGNALNHVGVIQEDGRILHHLRGRLSSVDVYGSWLQKCSGRQLRHYDWGKQASVIT